MEVFKTQGDLDQAVRQLMRVDKRFGQVVAHHGSPRLRRMEPTLESLLRIVTDQLISLKAGEAIWRRFEVTFPGCQAKDVALASVEALMGVGLSSAKARCFKAVATAADEGHLDLALLVRCGDDQALNTLQSLPGIGPWTADIFLLFGLGRADAWPSGDLALQVAAQNLLGLGERPNGKAMAALAEAWRPNRGAAAHLLWSHYRGLKGLPQAQD